MDNCTIFRCSKILGGKESKKFYNKCSENSRSQIVFQTDIFQKLSLGAPETTFSFTTHNPQIRQVST